MFSEAFLRRQSATTFVFLHVAIWKGETHNTKQLDNYVTKPCAQIAWIYGSTNLCVLLCVGLGPPRAPAYAPRRF